MVHFATFTFDNWLSENCRTEDKNLAAKSDESIIHQSAGKCYHIKHFAPGT